MVTVRAVRRLGRGTCARRGIIAKDFAFHGNSAANELPNYHDHGPGRGAAGTIHAKTVGNFWQRGQL